MLHFLADACLGHVYNACFMQNHDCSVLNLECFLAADGTWEEIDITPFEPEKDSA